MVINIKRVYETPETSDGNRILIDRLWPRGLTKEKADIYLWLKEIAPSSDLRKWFGHDPVKWEEFKKKYHAELKANKQVMQKLISEIKKGNVTLVYGARDEEHNDAVVLKQYLEKEK